MVDQLKLELKRTLRSRMNATINAVCVNFEERVDLSFSRPAAELNNAGTGDFGRYYECCRQLVRYIAKTMDTSPNFVEKMDGIIRASRDNASKSTLNAVVRQDVWFHRRSDGNPEKTMEIEGSTSTLGKRKHSQTKTPSKRYRLEQTAAYQFVDDANISEVNESEDNNEEENDEYDFSMEYTANEEKKTSGVNEEVVGDLFLLKPQSPGQLEAIKAWIHDVHELLDAQWCTPPTGFVCSRRCAELREQVTNESESCRTWQSVETHLEECQSLQCELRTRVELREAMYLVEVKQLEICGVRHDLKEKKVNWSVAVHYNDEACWIGDLPSELKCLEDVLEIKKEELIALKSKKASLCARMDSIRLDWRDEVDESSLHYVREA